MKALVIFSGSGEHPLTFLLKEGFHHCYTAILSKDNWLLVDWRRGVPVIEYVTRDFDLAAFYREQGLIVLETEQREKPLRSLFVPNNCVGFVKSVLCIKSYAITPYQLFKHLGGKL